MSETVGDGPRVKFAATHVGAFPTHMRDAATALATGVARMEALGCCPVLDDGLVAGNGALAVDGGLLVSRSGRRPGECSVRDVVYLERFDTETWSAEYRADHPDARPTSDAALYWLALVEAPTLLGWTERPVAALHGHVLETERAARALDLPISTEETLFSTPADRGALFEMFRVAPHPRHHAWIRLGHGFFVSTSSLERTVATVERIADRAHRAGLLPSRGLKPAAPKKSDGV